MPSELEPPSPRAEPEASSDANGPGPAVFPYEGETSAALADVALQRSTARGVLGPADPSTERGPVGSTACPACGSETTNGAGLFACHECEWTGVLR